MTGRILKLAIPSLNMMTSFGTLAVEVGKYLEHKLQNNRNEQVQLDDGLAGVVPHLVGALESSI